MMQYGKNLQRLSDTISRANDMLPGMPVVEMVGDRRILIENHRGVVQYGTEEICVKVKFGIVRILGSRMELAKMTKEQLVITGIIKSLAVQRKEEV